MKSRSWKLWIAGIALVQLVILGIDVALLWPWLGVTVTNFYKIEEGMSLAEVEAILGGPGETVRLPFAFPKDRYGTHYIVSGKGWVGGPSFGICVLFTEEGVVGAKYLSNGQDTLWDRLRWRFTRR
jgi:hypothetical protein